MSILLSNTKQNFLIDGVKFFKENLDKLKCDSMVTDHPITSSEIAVYMILHLHTDEMGQIRSFTKDKAVSERKQLCISHIAKEHDLTYETIKKAFDRLIERNYIAAVHTNNTFHYEIVDYTTYNQPENLSYFRIPTVLFQEKFFGQLIKHRFHKGALLLLELSQYFSRQVGMNKKTAEDSSKISGIREMKYLKKVLNTTAKRVRLFLSIIRNVFLFKPLSEKVKNPAKNRINRIREFVQIHIEKYSFSLNPLCFTKNDYTKATRLMAAATKEMAARIKYAKIPVKWRDILDINKSISRMTSIAINLEVVNKANKMMHYTVSKVADTLESMHLENSYKSIQSVGAFVNKLFTDAWKEYLANYMDRSERIEIGFNYSNKFWEPPTFMNEK